MPRTVYLTHWFPLLSETFVFFEVDGLKKRGFPLSVVSLYGCRFKNLAEHMRKADIPVQRLGLLSVPAVFAAVLRRLFRQPKLTLQIMRKLFFAPWRDMEMRLENYWALMAGFYLAEQFKQAGVRHMHGAWASGPATAAWVVRQLEGIEYSFTARATDVRPPDGFLAEKLADCAFARADSSFNVPHLQSFLAEQQRGKVHLVYNFVTLAYEKPAKVRMTEPYHIIAIGRLIEKKGFGYLVRAMDRVARMGVKAMLTIVGSGREMHALKEQVSEFRLEDRVRFTGGLSHEHIAALLAESDMLVMPSIIPAGTEQSDGLPTVITEAMTMGVPVVATDVASISDVVIDGRTGRLVPQKDEEALARAMVDVLGDRDNALRMATNARELVRGLLSEETTLGRMEKLFSQSGDQSVR